MDKEKPTTNTVNSVTLNGTVETVPQFSHDKYGERFFEFCLRVPRLSEQSDVLPITVSERLMDGHDMSIGAPLALEGQFRSYNKIEERRSKLMLTVFVREIFGADARKQLSSPNFVTLTGYICKPPIYRVTPLDREICDVLVAVNRAYNKSDYIPCIAWGRYARQIRDLKVGSKLLLSGRIQSREYTKKISDTEVITKIAYEVSISQVSPIVDTVSGESVTADDVAATDDRG